MVSVCFVTVNITILITPWKFMSFFKDNILFSYMKYFIQLQRDTEKNNMVIARKFQMFIDNIYLDAEYHDD